MFVLVMAGAAQGGEEPSLITIRARVHLVQAEKETALHTTLTEDDVKRVFGKVNMIWAQANIRIELESVVTEAANVADGVKKEAGYGWVVASLPKKNLLQNGLNIFYVKELADNGFFSGGLCVVKDTAKLAEVPGGLDEPIPRVTSHEIGHALGLQHRQDVINLMASKKSGYSLNAQEIALARATAMAKFEQKKAADQK